MPKQQDLFEIEESFELVKRLTPKSVREAAFA